MRALPRILKGVFAGAGSDGLNEPAICEQVLALTGKAAADVTLGYLGTATYDLEGPMRRQTAWFAERGCAIVPIRVGGRAGLAADDFSAAVASLKTVDIVLVSGGNTLYAMDRWHASGVADALRECADRGVVLCGGSAGAACWFDAAHSDSYDPDTFRGAMLAAAERAAQAGSGPKDESSAAPSSEADRKSWRYIRVSCLGFLPGFVCPHHDKTQSNGVPRADDFDAMLRRHPSERGVCIDHWAALVVDGDTYSVLSLAGKPGSVRGCAAGDMERIASASVAAGQAGIPGVWLKQVEGSDAPITTTLLPWTGPLADVLCEPLSPIVIDEGEAACRKENPAKV